MSRVTVVLLRPYLMPNIRLFGMQIMQQQSLKMIWKWWQDTAKFNTTLPPSAPAERLFSTAEQMEVSRHNQMSDSMFENLLLLKQTTVYFRTEGFYWHYICVSTQWQLSYIAYSLVFYASCVWGCLYYCASIFCFFFDMCL